MSTVSGEQLRSFIDRIERLEGEVLEIKNDIKEVYAEAKGTGFDVKVMKKIVALMKKDRDEVAEEEAIFETYKAALNL
ncbi:MAG: DUF2312 domain-containing protein [Alphaproteobacteria bacterium]|jgi:uncharacterized protein (UPF0335 family)|nr:DUF2312 domain-containing protein [Alphaproteobacteria bacterium]